jgi:uncharacterized membrane protein YdjX (TVP38/TMEM64 family)
MKVDRLIFAPDLDADDAEVAILARRHLWHGGVILFVVIMLFALAFALGWQKQVSLESLIRHRAAIEALVTDYPAVALASFVAFYAVASALALPGVIFLTMGGGVFFGGLLGGMASVVAATAGATVVFVAGKHALRSLIMRWIGPHVTRVARSVRRNAFNYLLFIRLVPIFPFTLGNLLPAVCGVRLVTFMAATFLGITPMTLAVAFFGAGLDSVLAAQIANYRACRAAGLSDCRLDFHLSMVVTPQLVGGLFALGIAVLLPVIVKRCWLLRNGTWTDR